MSNVNDDNYSFILLNIAHLLLNLSRDKSKIDFIKEQSSNTTLFICLCESYLNEHIEDAEINMSGFVVSRCDRVNRKGGGVCIFVKESINYKVLLKYCNTVCELLIVELIDPHLLIILIYRPPSCTIQLFKDIIDKMYECLFMLSSPLPNIIMLGDFNIPGMNWSDPKPSCAVSKVLCHFINTFFLEQLVMEPTRINNILDLVFSHCDLINDIVVNKTVISDHCILHVKTNITTLKRDNAYQRNPASSIFEKLNFNRCNWVLLRSSLKLTDWNEKVGTLSVNQCYEYLMDTIAVYCKQSSPFKKTSSHHVSKFYKERKGLMKKRTELRVLLSTSPRLTQCSMNKRKIEDKLLLIEDKLLSSHKCEKSHDELRAVDKIKEDPNYFFRYAKKFILTRQEVGPFYDDSGALTANKTIICELLLHQFNSVFSVPYPSKVVTDPAVFFSCTNMPHQSHAKISTIVINEDNIIEAINELCTTSAPGPDGMNAAIFKQCAHEIAKPLHILFTKMIECECIPDPLKLAAIVPIFKSGDKSMPSNYRPISLTPIMMKIFERIIRKQIVEFLTRHDLLNPTQHGFRAGRSCLSALLSVYDDLMMALSEDCGSVDMIYLDFAKAFDKVDHGILLHKLRSMGVTGKLGTLFFNFLADRKHFVRLSGGVSTMSPVLSGVPQGTVLGPLLFLILMSDISMNVNSSRIISFADDTRLYTAIHAEDDCDSLQKDLNVVYNWASLNNMEFNANKFNYVSFCASKNNNNLHVYIDPSMKIIKHVDNVKDLGIYMSADCTFEYHIISLYKRCSSLSGWILRTFCTRDTVTMLTLFKSLVLSRLDNGSQLWTPYMQKDIDLLENIQRSFTKHVTGMHDLPYKDRLTKLRLYSLQRRRERYQIIYAWKILENKVPNLTNPIIVVYSDRRGRYCKEMHVVGGRIGTLSYNSFRWKSIRLFNSLPKCIRDVTQCPIHVFKMKLDLHLSQITDNPSVPNFNNSLDKKYH